MSRRRWPDTLELQDRLNTNLLQGRKSAIQLNKHIRRLKSVKAYILNEKDKVKSELNGYVNKLLESLLDFKSEMLQQLDDVVKHKVEELSMMRMGLEEDIDTLNTLCEETEKLLQFDSEISTYMDLHRAETLEKAFRMLRNPADQLELGDVMNLKFVPAVDVEHLNCQSFGMLLPSGNGNGSQQELASTSSKCLMNLNCNKTLTCSDSKSTDMQVTHPNSSHDSKAENTTFGRTVQTDVNSNIIPNNSFPETSSKQIPGIDAFEIAAYMNELSLAQANRNLAFQLSQLQQISPDQFLSATDCSSFSVQNIPLPDHQSEIDVVANVPVQNIPSLESNIKCTVTAGSLSQINSLKEIECQPSSTPVKSKTPPPPGFIPQSHTGQNGQITDYHTQHTQVKHTKKDQESISPGKESGKGKHSKAARRNLDEDLKAVRNEKEEKPKQYIREAKFDVTCLNKIECKEISSFKIPKEDVKDKGSVKSKQVNNSESAAALKRVEKPIASTCIETNTSAECKKERSLNDLELSSDEEVDLIISDAEGKTPAMNLNDVDCDETKVINQDTGNYTKTLGDAMFVSENISIQNDISETAHRTETDQDENAIETGIGALVLENVRETTKLLMTNKEFVEKGLSVKNDSKPITETEILSEIMLSTEQVPYKTLRKPISLPNIPLKSHIGNWSKKENQVVHDRVKECLKGEEDASIKSSEEQVYEKSEEELGADHESEVVQNADVTDEKGDSSISTITVKQDFTISSPPIAKQKDEIVDKLPLESFIDSKISDAEVGTAQENTGVEKSDILPNNTVTETNEVKTSQDGKTFEIKDSLVKPGHEVTSSRREKRCNDTDKRTASERNIDVLINQASWCKKYIRKTLSPPATKKNGKTSTPKSESSTPKELNSNNSGSLDLNLNKKLTCQVKSENLRQEQKSFQGHQQSGTVVSKRSLHESKNDANISPGLKCSMEDTECELSTICMSESWDLEIENENKVDQNNKMGQSVNSSSCLASKPSPSDQVFKIDSIDRGLNERKDTSNIKQTQAPTTVATESWDLELESTDHRSLQNKNREVNTAVSELTDSVNVKLVVSNCNEISGCQKGSAVLSETKECQKDTSLLSRTENGQKGTAVASRTKEYFLERIKDSRSAKSVLESCKKGSRINVIKGRHITTLGSMGKGSSNGLYYPIGVTSNSLGDIIVTDTGNHLVKVYDCKGVFVKAIGQQLSHPLRRPSAAVVNDKDEIFVKDDTCIRKFERTGAHICDIGYRHLIKPFGLALTSVGILIVLDTYYQNPCLVHLSQDGSTIQKYRYQPLHGASPSSKCRFLAVSGNKVIVSDLGLSQVYVTDLKGCFLCVIGHYGRGPAEFCEPSGLAVDPFGNFVIGDSKNNKIKVWQCDGFFLGVIQLSEAIIRPSGIHFTCDNKLLISNYLEHQIKVYQLEL